VLSPGAGLGGSELPPPHEIRSLKPVVVTSTLAYYPQIITLIRAGSQRVSYEKEVGEDVRIAIERAETQSLRENSRTLEIPSSVKRAAGFLALSRLMISPNSELLIANAGRYRNSAQAASRLCLYGLDDDLVMGARGKDRQSVAVVFATKYDTEALLLEFDRDAINRRMEQFDKGFEPVDLIKAMGMGDTTGRGYETAAAIHTLSHALLRSVASAIGLDVTSIGEHLAPSQYTTVLYVKKAYEQPMGLLDQLENPGVHNEVFKGAIERLVPCHNDPACQKHPQGGCPTCVQIPEISCNCLNRPLKRTRVRGAVLGVSA